MEINELQADLAAFADDEGEVLIGNDGSFMLMRNGREISARLVESEDGQLFVEREAARVPYRTFLTRELAGLQTLAERIVSRRPPIETFIDSRVRASRASSPPNDTRSLDGLRAECQDPPAFSSRVTFITADAGHGKTALLRQYQYEQASAFVAGTSSYVFWHVDLQGRQLLRLSEALMGDLGELRITGLWMPALVRLMRHRALVLAVDGFDELAAEQGSTDALGALASLVAQLGGHGTVIAAARRTFFDTDDYLRRAGMLGRAISSPCEFNQLALLPWSRTEGVAYVQRAEALGGAVDAEEVYDAILAEVGNDSSHPMVTRPFLLAQLVRAFTEFGIEPADFIRTADDPLSGVAAVVQAFIRREVAEKWKSRDGQPYLTENQHMHLLADIAEEMYRSQKDRLDIEVIETIASLLMDQWSVDVSNRAQILDMVRMHVLLVPPDGDGRYRSFDHPEFRDYFIAIALRVHIERAMEGLGGAPLAQYLSSAQLTDSTARYVCGMIDRSEFRVRTLLAELEVVLDREWKPTFLQVNVGTLIPFLLNGVTSDEPLGFSGKAVYSSLVFEGTRLQDVFISRGSFVNASLCDVNWQNVTLQKCDLGELVINPSARFEGVQFDGCTIDGLRIRSDDDDIREYAPHRIWEQLALAGVAKVSDSELAEGPIDVCAEDPPAVRVLRRMLRLFSRSTVITDEQLQRRFRQEQATVFGFLIPLMEQHGVLAEGTWKGAGHHRVWNLTVRIDDVLAAEDGIGAPSLVAFWVAVSS